MNNNNCRSNNNSNNVILHVHARFLQALHESLLPLYFAKIIITNKNSPTELSVVTIGCVSNAFEKSWNFSLNFNSGK